MKHFGITLAVVLLVGVSGIAADNDARDKFAGSWIEAGGGMPSGWTFAMNGDSFHVTQTEGNSTVADYPCNSVGKECAAKLSGKKAGVSIYFNGSKLVLVETQGSTVVKRRFTVTSSGDEMAMEVMSLVPAGKTETLQFKRSSLSTQTK